MAVTGSKSVINEGANATIKYEGRESKEYFDIIDKKDSANCQTQQPVGLKKNLNEYTHSDIPQLCEEITESYSNLLGPLPLKLPFWSFLLGSQDLKVNLCGLQQDICSDGVK